jgi:hypothetical protein
MVCIVVASGNNMNKLQMTNNKNQINDNIQIKTGFILNILICIFFGSWNFIFGASK